MDYISKKPDETYFSKNVFDFFEKYNIRKNYIYSEELIKYATHFKIVVMLKTDFWENLRAYSRYKDFLIIPSAENNEKTFRLIPFSDIRRQLINKPLPSTELLLIPEVASVTPVTQKVDDRIKQDCFTFFENYMSKHILGKEYTLNKQVTYLFQCIQISVSCKQLFHYLKEWYITKGKDLLLKSDNEMFDYNNINVRNEPKMVITVLGKQDILAPAPVKSIEPIKPEPIQPQPIMETNIEKSNEQDLMIEIMALRKELELIKTKIRDKKSQLVKLLGDD